MSTSSVTLEAQAERTDPGPPTKPTAQQPMATYQHPSKEINCICLRDYSTSWPTHSDPSPCALNFTQVILLNSIWQRRQASVREV